MSSRAGVILVVTVLVAMVGGVVAIDQLVPPADPAAVQQSRSPVESTGGQAVCPVGDGRSGTSLDVSVATPGQTDEASSDVEVATVEDGERRPAEEVEVAPGTAARMDLEGDQAVAVGRWFDAQSALYRTWRLDGEEGLPAGTVAGPCVPETSDDWYLPGMMTSGGNEARLRLANPYQSDATVRVSFVTPEGVESPTVLQNVTVGGREVTEVEVNEHLPERDDVSARVQVISGRVAAEGYQLAREEIGDVDGASLLASTPRPSTSWTVPWISDAGDRQSWLWILNPSERPAPVQLTMHTTDGEVAPEGLGEVTVAPGQLRRVDLRGTFPEDASTAGVTASSGDVPVVVSGAVRQTADDAEDTGLAVQLGARPDRQWLIAGGQVQGRVEQLRLLNPGSEPARVDVRLWDGSETSSPEELSDVEVPAGGLATLPLQGELGDAEDWAAFVEATEGEVVAGHVGRSDDDDDLHLVAGPASPGASLGRDEPLLPARRDLGLSQRLGTELSGRR